MAQYLHDAGGQGEPFGYGPDWFPVDSSFGESREQPAQQSILDPSDNALLNDFWTNPHNFTVNMNTNWAAMDQKENNYNFGGHFDGFEQENHTIHNPSATLSGAGSSHYHTHLADQHVKGTDLMTDELSNQTSHMSADDLQGASGLFSMLQGQSHPYAATIDTSGGASWGAIDASNPQLPMQEQLQSPMTSSGRQSASSYSHRSHNHAMNHQQYGTLYPNSHMTPQQLYPQQPMLHNNGARARHQSLQIHTNASSGYQFFPSEAAGFHMPPHTAHPQVGRPPAVRFGSDNNFSHGGYRDPDRYSVQEQVKGSNLNNVPFAAQVASANGHTALQNFTSSMTQPRAYQHWASDFKNSPQNATSVSSPRHLGGLPYSAADPMAGINRHGHPYNNMARRTIEDVNDEEEDEDDEEEFVKAPPLKRRKSQMTRDEDDEEYTPSAIVRTASKRGSRVAVGDASDDDYTVTPTTSKASIKRRKSNATTRRSFGSDDEDESPTGISSPSAEPRSSSKKKSSRPSQNRSNLTEEEKRRNHIASEKTRRDLIKNQYDELDNMIPALKTGKSGLSRSDVLKEIVGFTETVIAGNQEMERLLHGPRRGSAFAGASNRSAGEPE